MFLPLCKNVALVEDFKVAIVDLLVLFFFYYLFLFIFIFIVVEDRCKIDNGGCDHWCAHVEGVGYKCLCKPGFLLDVDRHSCVRKLLTGFAMQYSSSLAWFDNTSVNLFKNFWKTNYSYNYF